MQISLLILALRERIEPKLIYSPFLRLIVFNVWFQLGFAAFVLTLVSAALYLPKIWRVTPDGFEPVVHVSGLDMTQAWALKRSARKAQEARDFARAAESLQGAVSENPADISALRGFLENTLNLNRSDKRFNQAAIGQMQWLLRINHTNMADVDLISRVCDRFGWYDLGAYFFGPIQNQQIPGSAEAVLAKNLFYQNRIPEFSNRLEKKGDQLNDPELKYYRLALEAGWDRGDSEKAFRELEQAAASGEGRDRVGHILLRAAAQKNKLDLYSQELNSLASRNEATASDHAMYWTLLASNGRTNEAVKLAESFALSPSSTLELINVAQSYLSLGLVDNAANLLKRLAPQFASAPEVWISYFGVLETKQDWDELRAAARTIRQDVSVRETLWGLSYFMEGRSELGQKRDAAALEAFNRAAESAYDYEAVGLFVARSLTRLGFPQVALRIYASVEPRLDKSVEYWNGVFIAAYAAKDAASLLKASEQSYRLNSTDTIAVNRYAASLLLNRQKPEEAIQLTLQLYTKFPQSAASIINHSCSLLLNHRAAEARTLLEGVDVRSLGSTELSPYYLALFETYHALKMWDQAWRVRDKIVESSLFPIQREWLRQKDGEMPKELARKV